MRCFSVSVFLWHPSPPPPRYDSRNRKNEFWKYHFHDEKKKTTQQRFDFLPVMELSGRVQIHELVFILNIFYFFFFFTTSDLNAWTCRSTRLDLLTRLWPSHVHTCSRRALSRAITVLGCFSQTTSPIPRTLLGDFPLCRLSTLPCAQCCGRAPLINQSLNPTTPPGPAHYWPHLQSLTLEGSPLQGTSYKYTYHSGVFHTPQSSFAHLIQWLPAFAL